MCVCMWVGVCVGVGGDLGAKRGWVPPHAQGAPERPSTGPNFLPLANFDPLGRTECQSRTPWHPSAPELRGGEPPAASSRPPTPTSLQTSNINHIPCPAPPKSPPRWVLRARGPTPGLSPTPLPPAPTAGTHCPPPPPSALRAPSSPQELGGRFRVCPKVGAWPPCASPTWAPPPRAPGPAPPSRQSCPARPCCCRPASSLGAWMQGWPGVGWPRAGIRCVHTARGAHPPSDTVPGQ